MRLGLWPRARTVEGERTSTLTPTHSFAHAHIYVGQRRKALGRDDLTLPNVYSADAPLNPPPLFGERMMFLFMLEEQAPNRVEMG